MASRGATGNHLHLEICLFSTSKPWLPWMLASTNATCIARSGRAASGGPKALRQVRSVEGDRPKARGMGRCGKVAKQATLPLDARFSATLSVRLSRGGGQHYKTTANPDTESHSSDVPNPRDYAAPNNRQQWWILSSDAKARTIWTRFRATPLSISEHL